MNKNHNTSMNQNYNTSLFEMVEGELRISHLVIASTINSQPASVSKLITNYSEELNDFGKIASKKSKKKVYFLNREQLGFLFYIIKMPSANLFKLVIKLKDSFKAIEEFSKEDNVDTRKGFVYVAEFDNGNLKVGHSINPTQRLRNLETQSGNNIIKYSLFEFQTKNESLKAETDLLRNLKEWRIIGEYIGRSYKYVVETAKKIFKAFNYMENIFLFYNYSTLRTYFQKQNWKPDILQEILRSS